ncbi:hypothetical protein D9758_015776 [Tetrapyrgos nigripes]|uniref:Beta-glucuronidase C-terminal domain-containing protein n=1 Tax=Tetrapyrgos nigripes TaxID=182062 RepID=A0A8H5C3V5_9AGAR|nr:hypothetical protein D9758_015776 [Tetrapyrgos nigripes]
MTKDASFVRKILFFLPYTAALTHAITVNLPFTAPDNAPTVSGSLFSLSLEQDRWLDWVGTASTGRNEFFFNTLDNLIQITGEAPHIRIGADSADHTDFGVGVKDAEAIFPEPTEIEPYPEATNITVGDAFYEAVRFLPPHTHVIWGVNFATKNITSAFLQAQAIQRAFSSNVVQDAGIILDAVEVGNEPNIYPRNTVRPVDYNISEYVQEWIPFASNVSAASGITPNSHTQFWGGSFADSFSELEPSTSGFSPQGLFGNGILNSEPGKLIKTFSQHHYNAFCFSNCGTLQLEQLLTKSTIRSNLSIFAEDVAVVRDQGWEYVLGETNSNPLHGAPGLSNVAGAALWALDYALFAAQMGVRRVFFHEGVGYKYNLIQPTTLTRSPVDGSTLPSPLPPHIQPPYYAAIIAAEAIGNNSRLGDGTRLVELALGNSANLSAYTFFEDFEDESGSGESTRSRSRLARAVFINLEVFSSSMEKRTSVHVDFDFDFSDFGDDSDARRIAVAPSMMQVKRLAIGHADDTSGLTWGGVTYETNDGRYSGEESIEIVDVEDGFDIQATEVVLLSFLFL